MKFEIFKFKNVTSTNDAAIDLIKNEKKNSGCVSAEIQTKGRGTRGKKWISKKGNFFCSIFFQLKNHYPSFKEFSIINPIIISEVIKKFCNKKISIKSPNDVLVNRKKICGILQEIITLDKNKYLIIGIGINIDSSPIINGEYEATNIYYESNKKPTIEELIQNLTFFYEEFFNDIKSYNFINFKKKADLLLINNI